MKINKQQKWDQYYMDQARTLAETFSKAKRLKVGAVLVHDNRPLANGFNGLVAGLPGDCEIPYPNEDGTGLKTRSDVVHAEANLIAFCAKEGISTKNTTVYVTAKPCMTCCTLMYSAGVERIVYDIDYVASPTIAFCDEVGLQLEKFVGHRGDNDNGR